MAGNVSEMKVDPFDRRSGEVKTCQEIVSDKYQVRWELLV
jgi:hypothetical protein